MITLDTVHDDAVGPVHATDPEPALSKAARVVLDWLRDADEPHSVTSIANAVGRHTNSVRMHLDDLIAAGLVRTESARAVGRGRPMILYSAAPAPLPPVTIVKPLAEALAALPDGSDRARAAGALWSQELGLSDRPGELEPALARMGFEPQADTRGYQLHTCPWLDAAKAHPEIVCTLHEGLTQDIVGSETGVELRPFTSHRTCDLLITRRPDRD